MKKVVFVCTGNTCRSPMAEGLFKKLLEEKNIKDIMAVSRGIACVDGEAATENAFFAMKLEGVDISSHRSKMLSKDDFLKDALFVCMTQQQVLEIKKFNRSAKICCLDISDPFGLDLSFYISTSSKIKERLPEILRLLTDELKICNMKKEDISFLARIERENFSVPWSEQSLKEELENPNARFFTAFLNGEIAGYIGAFNVCGEVSVSSVVVRNDLRNKGIGGKLLNKLEIVSRTEKAEFITLEVRKTNEAAQRLYLKNGYEPVGVRKGFYEKPKEDAILMTKYLK